MDHIRGTLQGESHSSQAVRTRNAILDHCGAAVFPNLPTTHNLPGNLPTVTVAAGSKIQWVFIMRAITLFITPGAALFFQ